MDIKDIDYSTIAAHIPHVMQMLYIDSILESTSLVEIRDAFRVNQMQSKAWMLDQLKDTDRNAKILVVGSWFGFTSYCLFKMGFTRIIEVDPDSRFRQMSGCINRENHNLGIYCADVNDIDVSTYDIIINTSCEHISNNSWFDQISPGTLVILQSTNFAYTDHINIVSDIGDMKSKYPLNYTYEGELKFNDKFTRFMLCGTKP